MKHHVIGPSVIKHFHNKTIIGINCYLCINQIFIIMIRYNPELHKELILKEIKSWRGIMRPELPSIPKNEPLTSVFIETGGETYVIPSHVATQLVIEANKDVIDECQQFGMTSFVPKRIYYNKVCNLSDITTDMPMKKWTVKIDYTK